MVSKSATISVTSVLLQITELTCSPTTISSGASTTCKVTLSSPAPAGGSLVTLSDNSASLTVPASVTIAAGGKSGMFHAIAGGVTRAQTASLSAVSNGSLKTVSINVLPPPAPLTWVVCSPTYLASQATGICTVALSSITREDLFIAITDDNALLATPTSVIVPASASKATFQITTGTITTAQTAV